MLFLVVVLDVNVIDVLVDFPSESSFSSVVDVEISDSNSLEERQIISPALTLSCLAF